MFNTLMRRFLSPKARPLPHASWVKSRLAYSFRPKLDYLEDRTAPAVAGSISVVNDTLYYNGAINNIVSVSGTDGAFTISDAAGTISVPVALQSNFSGNGTSTVTGSLVTAGVAAVAIDTDTGFDTFSTSGLAISRAFSANADVINVNGPLQAGSINLTAKPKGVINLNGSLDSTGANAATGIAGNIYLIGNVNVSAGQHAIITDGTTLDGNVQFFNNAAGVGGLDLNIVTPGLTGSENAGGNFTALGGLNLGGNLDIGYQGSGVNGIAPGANNVSLYASTIVAGHIAIDAENAVTLNGALNAGGFVDILANQDALGNQGFSQTVGDIVTGSQTINITVNTVFGTGTGSAIVRGITTVAGGTVFINTSSSLGGGAIYDGNGSSLNINTGSGGSLFANAGPGGVNLDTFTSYVQTSSVTGDINIRNSGSALGVSAGTYNGNIFISNNADIATANPAGIFVGPAGAEKTVTLTTTGGNVSITNGITAPGQVIINASGTITGFSGIAAPTVSLTAGTGIGAIPITSVSTVTAATSSGGITLTGNHNLTIAGASAGAGNISVTTTGASDLTLTGNVTATVGSVTLTSGQDLYQTNGTVSSGNSSTITLTPGRNLTMSLPAAVSTGGAIAVTAPAAKTVESIGGKLTGSAVTINGASAAFTTNLIIPNTAAIVATSFAIATTSTGTTQYTVGGTIDSTGTISISATGPLTLTTNGTLTSTGTTTITAGTANASVLNLNGIINSGGALAIKGSNTATTTLVVSGSTTSTRSVSITGGTSGTFFLNATGPIQGTTVTVTGSSGAANTIDLNGKVTATAAGGITVTTAADSAASNITIGGQMTALSGTTQLTGSSTAADQFSVTPSATSTFNFTFGSGANTLFINSPISNILSSTANFGSPITFAPLSGFLSWTKTAGGTVSVSPTVP